MLKLGVGRTYLKIKIIGAQITSHHPDNGWSLPLTGRMSVLSKFWTLRPCLNRR
jgi:hypothetical protein